MLQSTRIQTFCFTSLRVVYVGCIRNSGYMGQGRDAVKVRDRHRRRGRLKHRWLDDSEAFMTDRSERARMSGRS